MSCRLRRVACTGAILGSISLFGCTEQRKTKAAAQPVVPVTVAVVRQKDVPVEITAIGSVQAYSTVAVKSLVEGQVVDVNFREGQEVEKGQRLFTIDKAPFQAALDQAASTLARDEAQAAQAQAQARRYEQLKKQGIVAEEQAETILTASQSAAALVRADRAALEQARLKLRYCDIFAPITGRTGDLLVHAGNLVKQNGDNPMVTINQISPIYASFSVPEQYLGEIKQRLGKGRQLFVDATWPTNPAQVRGTLSFVDNAVDSNTGMIKLKATFVNAEHVLWPGQFVNVVLRLATEPRAIVIPPVAVENGQQGEFVFVIRPGNTAELRPIALGRQVGKDEIVVARGLQPGERVVTDGQLRLANGARVEVRETPGSPPPKAAVVGDSPRAPSRPAKNQQLRQEAP